MSTGPCPKTRSQELCVTLGRFWGQKGKTNFKEGSPLLYLNRAGQSAARSLLRLNKNLGKLKRQGKHP